MVFQSKFIMFVVRNKFNGINEIFSLQTKSLYKKGVREFKKLNSFPSFHYVRFVSQRTPILFNEIFFKMRNSKKTKPNAEQLAKIKTELQSLNPFLQHLKVKRFYNTGRVIVRATIGNRRIRVTGSLLNITDKFTSEYQDRLSTAFTNLNTI